MKVLITGASGFAGRHLARLLLSQGFEVHAACREKGASLFDGQLAGIYQYSLNDTASVRSLVGDVNPDQIYHLAAVTSESEIIYNPQSAFDVNVIGTEILLQAVAEVAPGNSVLISGSSAEYGSDITGGNKITESTPLSPVTLYGISKVAQSMVGYRHFVKSGLRVIRTRAFNYAGPGQSDKFVISSMCRKIAEIETGKSEPILTTGNLNGWRDFTDVRDIVKAYQAALEKGQPGCVYNISSGKGVQIKSIVEILLSYSKSKITVKSPPPEQAVKTDVSMQVGCADLLRSISGWKPEIGLEQTLQDTLDYWRTKV